MAELLKITTPLVNKSNQVQPNKQVTDPTVPFNLQDVQTVKKPVSQEQILGQNTGLIDRENSANLLTNLLKDPAQAVGFLKNIYVLEELIKLLPANNSPFTQEIEQLFNALLISPESIAQEMHAQESTSTIFRGELFDFLRVLVRSYPTPEVKFGVANLLKSINSMSSRGDALRAVANDLQFMADSLRPTHALADRLENLATAFQRPNAPAQFPELKREVLSLLGEMENSLLFSDKLDKVSAITLYNLSRFNDNPDYFQEAVSGLLPLLSAKERTELLALVREFREEGGENLRKQGEMSKVMDILTRIIHTESGDKTASLSTTQKVEKVIYSLLSSPCHFTPLLHFVIPVEYNELKAFAEIWVNPDGQEDRRDPDRGDGQPCTHMLLVFDIEGFGSFETEVYAIGKRLSVSLFCPPAYVEQFSKMAGRFQQCVAGTSYKFDQISVQRLERPRSLMDVFKSLPYKRTGVDVKV